MKDLSFVGVTTEHLKSLESINELFEDPGNQAEHKEARNEDVGGVSGKAASRTPKGTSFHLAFPRFVPPDLEFHVPGVGTLEGDVVPVIVPARTTFLFHSSQSRTFYQLTALFC
ncbi:unnamed protein product [Cuscuta epithymum]|uniref:Uncharacterized protein n=1 Tax=Cuscuta epithymum TaxID=186058 RepID=A0AAV0FX86_9ASTE|nr:unnamed protein product [Cuscuta epithymum]CAH9140257.1 unnamed protein product [Cuscuta epithymum]